MLGITILGADVAMRAQPQDALGHGYSRPARSPHSSRSEVVAPHGMVAASQPLAAQVGLDILKAGGNAIDAAVAVNAMLGLVEPHMNGVGGDLFGLVWDAETERLHGLNATGRAPYEISRETLVRQGYERMPGNGPLTWTVPGAVDGWQELLERFGTMELADVLAPAIAYARNGFPVSEIIRGQWAGAAAALAQWPDSAATYLPDGRPPRVGEVFRNPRLAATYEAVAEGGRDAFYKGDIARRIVAFSEANGGYFTMADFEDHSSVWVEPVSTSYRGYDVWEVPPNSSGILALMILNLMEGYDVAALGHNSAEAIHLYTEAKKLVWADRDTYVADADANQLPTAGLISKPYADARRKLIDRERAALDVAPGQPFEHSDTVYLTVVDKGPQRRLPHREHLRQLRLQGRPGRSRLRAPEPRLRLRARGGATSTRSSPTSARSTPTCPASSRRTASRSCRSVSWAARCSHRATGRCCRISSTSA